MTQLGLSWSLVSSGLVALALAACGAEDESKGLIGTRLVINEALATNTGFWEDRDDFGESDDWIELYNGHDFEIRLGGYFLSDDADDTMKSELSKELAIGPRDVLVLWADGQPEQGSIHLDFKLGNKDGQGVYLSDPRGRLVDRVTLQETKQEESFARIPNGTGEVQRCGMPSRGKTNFCWNGDLEDIAGAGGSNGS